MRHSDPPTNICDSTPLAALRACQVLANCAKVIILLIARALGQAMKSANEKGTLTANLCNFPSICDKGQALG